jgi:predicted metal-dependent hydrolase
MLPHTATLLLRSAVYVDGSRGESSRPGLALAAHIANDSGMPVLHIPDEVELDDGRRVPYRIRVSRRARQVRLTLTPRDGLVMVTPPGVDRVWVAELAGKWRGWIARQLDQMGITELQGTANSTPELPQRIELPAVAETWHILYRYSPRGGTRAREVGPGSLLLSGDCSDARACCRALGRWLMRRARLLLPAWLEQLSQETGLVYSRAGVRAQRSRWGSCSSSGDISLNYQILFLPPALARHVLIHELCHTVQLDHSPRFWRTVARFEPDLEQLRAEMRRSWAHVPDWLVSAT